jgi:CarD family transcriptional regulator
MAFKVNDKVVHPMHGAGVITEIAEKNILGEPTECVVIRLMVGNAGILLPTDTVDDTELRHVISKKDMQKALDMLKAEPEELPKDWRRRIETLKERVHSGEPGEVARAIRDVKARSANSKMNPSEKRVLSEAMGVLAGEVALVKDIKVDSAKALIKRLSKPRKKKKGKKEGKK